MAAVGAVHVLTALRENDPTRWRKVSQLQRCPTMQDHPPVLCSKFTLQMQISSSYLEGRRLTEAQDGHLQPHKLAHHN